MLRLTFRALHGEAAMVLTRAAYFRICEDATLRGPDNTVAAVYADHCWLLGSRRFRSFDCEGPVYLRVKTSAGGIAQTGPYGFRTSRRRLALYPGHLPGHLLSGLEPASAQDHWREIALLSAATPAPYK
jgi:hypothetical protein